MACACVLERVVTYAWHKYVSINVCVRICDINQLTDLVLKLFTLGDGSLDLNRLHLSPVTPTPLTSAIPPISLPLPQSTSLVLLLHSTDNALGTLSSLRRVTVESGSLSLLLTATVSSFSLATMHVSSDDMITSCWRTVGLCINQCDMKHSKCYNTLVRLNMVVAYCVLSVSLSSTWTSSPLVIGTQNVTCSESWTVESLQTASSLVCSSI